MASYHISLVFVFAFAFGLLLVSAEYGGTSERVTVRSIQPSFNSTAKAVSLATRTTNPSDVPRVGELTIPVLHKPLRALLIGYFTRSVLGILALYGNLSPLSLEQLDDPCLPRQLSWIECNTDTIPRITALYLGGKGLSGFLPDISYMDALVTIDLHQNSIFGPIPSFLGTLPNLQELYLANNLFSGLVPDSVACNKNLKLSLTGNPYLSTTSNKCLTSDPESPATRTKTDPTVSGGNFDYPSTNNRKKSKKMPIILGSVGSVVGVFWIIVGIFAIFCHKAKAAAAMAAVSAPGRDGVPNDPNLKPNSNSNPMSPSEETPINPRARDSP